jgi:hypothetical protein
VSLMRAKTKSLTPRKLLLEFAVTLESRELLHA